MRVDRREDRDRLVAKLSAAHFSHGHGSFSSSSSIEVVRVHDLQTAEAILVPRRSGGGASPHCNALRGRLSTLSPVDLSREEGQASPGKKESGKWLDSTPVVLHGWRGVTHFARRVGTSTHRNRCSDARWSLPESRRSLGAGALKSPADRKCEQRADILAGPTLGVRRRSRG